jgi:UDP:flavonoid glycosyltransferase YjiC (YdhE family)
MALSTVLTQDSFRHQAQRLQRSLLAHNGPEEAAELILRLARTKAPILSSDIQNWHLLSD